MTQTGVISAGQERQDLATAEGMFFRPESNHLTVVGCGLDPATNQCEKVASLFQQLRIFRDSARQIASPDKHAIRPLPVPSLGETPGDGYTPRGVK